MVQHVLSVFMVPVPQQVYVRVRIHGLVQHAICPCVFPQTVTVQLKGPVRISEMLLQGAFVLHPGLEQSATSFLATRHVPMEGHVSRVRGERPLAIA